MLLGHEKRVTLFPQESLYDIIPRIMIKTGTCHLMFVVKVSDSGLKGPESTTTVNRRQYGLNMGSVLPNRTRSDNSCFFFTPPLLLLLLLLTAFANSK